MKKNWKKYRTNIPNKVKISSRAYYEVFHTKDFHFDKENEKTFGITRFDPKQIVLNDNQGNKEHIHTFLHEVLHAISHEYNVNLTENQIQKLEKAMPYFMDLISILKGDKT
jgi:Zn-dependent peptidase ImmA (M78 family)